MRTDQTLRRTSVYSLRVEQPRDGANTLLDLLVLIAPLHGGTVTDAHAATSGGVEYVSVSFRIPSSDEDAMDLALTLIDSADLTGREAYLHTGLGAHRRLIDLPLASR